MSSYYDKYGGNPSYISVSASYEDNNKIIPTVPLYNGSTFEVKKTPNFKSLFEDYKMHNPEEHRAYLFVPLEGKDNNFVFYNGPNALAKNGQVYSSYPQQISAYDKTKVEFQTVVKDDVSYLAPSTNYVNYLKQQDEIFSLSIVELTYFRNEISSVYNSSPQWIKEQHYSQYPTAINNYNAKITAVNNQFNSFVSDMCRSLIELNKPFYATVSGADYDIPVSIGNFNAYELDKFVCSVFGNVTDDDFIPSVNEEIYNAKTSTGCCLKVCVTKELYRKEGVSYEQSQDKVQDDIEFQKWLNSDEFTPYVPPAPYKEITIDKYLSYLNEAQSFARSPLKYAFEKFKPFLEQGLIDLKNHGHLTEYKIKDNQVSLYFNGAVEDNNSQYNQFLNMFRR